MNGKEFTFNNTIIFKKYTGMQAYKQFWSRRKLFWSKLKHKHEINKWKVQGKGIIDDYIFILTTNLFLTHFSPIPQ